MIDTEFKVYRFIAVYSEETEELIDEHPITSFDLPAFQAEFNEPNPKSPMFDCYPITPKNIDFIRKYITPAPEWDFVSKSYFVEAVLPSSTSR
jgi:hypothetical protein